MYKMNGGSARTVIIALLLCSSGIAAPQSVDDSLYRQNVVESGKPTPATGAQQIPAVTAETSLVGNPDQGSPGADSEAVATPPVAADSQRTVTPEIDTAIGAAIPQAPAGNDTGGDTSVISSGSEPVPLQTIPSPGSSPDTGVAIAVDSVPNPAVMNNAVSPASDTIPVAGGIPAMPGIPAFAVKKDSGTATTEDLPAGQKTTASLREEDRSAPALDSLMKLLSDAFAMPTATLSLDDAIDYLLRYNPFVISTRLEWLANERKATASLGVFEPVVTGGYKYSDTRYNYRPYPELNLEQSLALKGKLINGTDYSVEYRLNDIRYNRSSLERPQAFSGVSVTQPLLRDVWFGSTLADRKIAETEREIAYHTYRSKIIEMVAELQSAYWNMAFAQEKYRFALQSVGIAKKVVNDSRMRLKTGKMSPMDLMEADAGLAAREANLADAAQELLDAANQLKLLLSTDKIGNDALLFCTESIFVESSDSSKETSSDPSFASVFAFHPEYQVRLLELDKEDITLKYRAGQCLPALNAKGSYGFNGFGNTAPDALYRLLNNPQPAWSAVLEVGLPLLGGVEARNLLAAQKLKKEAAEKNLSATKYQIANSFRIIIQRVSAHRDHARQANSVVVFRKRLLEVEFKKLDAGKSNNRLIYETEEKLSEARQWQLESNVRYRMAIVQKAKISGSMLKDFGLETLENGRTVISKFLTQRTERPDKPSDEVK